MNIPAADIVDFRAVREALWQASVIIVIAAVLGIGTNALRTGGITLVQDWSPAALMRDDQGNRTDISLENAEQLFHGGGAVILDARSRDEYSRGHIRGSRSLPLQDVDLYLEEAAGDVSPGTPIITYCDGEACSLSHDLAKVLEEFGFEDVRVLVNGWTLWLENGLPIERGLQPE
jgi:rhodanese-related sulfurtransferase